MTVRVEFSDKLERLVDVPSMEIEAETLNDLIAVVTAETRLTPAMFVWKNGRAPGVAILVGRSVIKGRYSRSIANMLKPGESIRLMATM